jgi:REP element-mobilizing transposase RayT
MPFRLRIEFPGAIYHVFNRGNFRSDLFASPDVIDSFRRTFFEAALRFHWQVEAFALMRNHYHFAIATQEPNLSVGMQWLQSTFAVRFNRLRDERGHLFQGRYHALLVESGEYLARLVNYIHLNPVVAGVATVPELRKLTTTSLFHFIGGSRPEFLECDRWLNTLQLPDSVDGWNEYLKLLARQAAEKTNGAEDAVLTRGWAIGTQGWRRALAIEKSRPLLPYGSKETQEARELQWALVLDEELSKRARKPIDLDESPNGARWKIAIAYAVRQRTTATNAWLARKLKMGAASSVSQYLSQVRRGIISILGA